jgi:hypothetical protein
MSAKKPFFILLLIMLITGICGTAEATASWLSNYSHRVVIPVNATAVGAQTDYQMQIILHSKSGDNSAGDIYLNDNLQDTTNFNDIGFTASDGTTLKDFWIQKVEYEAGGRKATVYVELDTPASGSTDYYLYYGKSGDTSVSNYDNTFTKDYGESGLVGLWSMDVSPGSELLTDGGLETWASSTDLTNWTENGTFTGIREITQNSTEKYAGLYSVKLSATGNDGTADFGIHQDITTVNNEKYQVNFYQEYSSRTQGTLKVEAWDNTNSVSLGSQSIITASTSFSFVSILFTSTNTASVRIKVYLNDETTGVAYIDALSVKQSSATLTDSSGHSNTGTIYGASRTDTDGGQWGDRSDVVFATGSALNFDGVNDYVNAGTPSTLNLSNVITYEAWVYPPAYSTSSTKFITGNCYYSGGWKGGWCVGMYATAIPYWWGFVSTQAGDHLSTGSSSQTPVVLNQWVHIVYTYDNASAKIYINGVLKDTDSSANKFEVPTISNSTVIAKNPYSNSYTNAIIDEVRIYNRALSADEISRHYIRSKYANPAPAWAIPESEQQIALETLTQSATLISFTGATLNGWLSGFGGDSSATGYFKWGLSQDNLDHTTDSQILTDYGSFSKEIVGLSPDTTYYFQAFAENSSETAQGSILSFKTDALETDYYGIIINTDGSLNFINKSTGATILSNFPKFYFNYGAITSTEKAVNGSFEIDNDHDNIPDNWSVDKAYIRLSTEQASDGSKSLKFNATAPDFDHRRACSSLITITQDARYTISIDSYMSSFTSGFAQVYAYYYETVNGTGPAYLSSYLAVPTITGSWVNTSFEWTPPTSARSFKLLIYMDRLSVATVYFDNVSIIEKNYVYTSNGSDIEHTVIVNGDTTTITATDDSNPYTTVNHQYQLNTHSPYINYTVTLQYKQDVFTTGERFDFVVPSQIAQVMTRALQLTSFNASNTYWSDLYTPKVVRFANGLSFLGSDTMESMRLQTSGSNSQVSFYSDYGQNHPHFYYIKNGGGATTSVNETQRSAGDTYSASVTFAIDTNESLQYLVKTRQPYGYDAILTLTNHPDGETLARIKAVAYGTENESDPDYGTKGIAGRGIGWTKGVFVSGAGSYADLSKVAFKTLIDQMYQDGVVIVGHSITPGTDSRAVVAAGLATLSQYNSKCWIDHSAIGGASNWEDLASQGAIEGSPYYILDLLDQYDYQYAWSYIDLTTDNYALNMLKPSDTSDIRPFLFYNNRVDDNVYDNKKIYLWSTINTLKTPDWFYTNDRVNTLISERGVHISHEYFGYSTCQNHAWYSNWGTIEIYPTFDCQLEYIAGKQAAGLLWSPPRAELGDYLVPLKDVLVTYNSDGTITVTNNSLVDVTGITLLAENNIQSVTIDNYDLVSFGDSYGDKEIVLPTIASGDSVVLNISYGAKDSSVPTIVSNDTGKNKVNEITGYWDDISKILTMTAEGHSGNYSFTVTIPSLANKTIIVKDVTLDTIIGEYDASDSGAITFTASLGSLHTFKIIEKPFVDNFDVDNFDSYWSDCELRNVWHPNPSLVWLNTDPNFVHDGNHSMLYPYEEDAEVKVRTSDLPDQITSDWTLKGVKALAVHFYGAPPNSVLPMYVKLKDGSGNEGVVTYGDNGEDPNDLRIAGWHEWNINLEDFNSAGVDLTNVKYIYLGFGEGNGSGTVYFDDIRLYQPRCFLSKRSGDFAKVDYAPPGNPAGDCVIDYRELEIMAGNWLMTPPDPNVDLYGDGVIDFRDFAVLADMWLEEELWPYE